MPRDRDEEEEEDRPRQRREDDYDDDEDDRPRRRRRRDEGDATGGLIPYKNGKALTAYYLGVFGFIPCVLGLGVFGIVAIILGVLGLKHVKKYPEARGTGHAISGIVMGLIQVLCSVALIVYIVVVVAAKK